jgi:hypothetical protein
MHVIPAIIRAKTALDETVRALRPAVNRINSNRSVREELEYVYDLERELAERATECLRTACAARDLTMLVIDPRTRERHEVLAEYFDQRLAANAEFQSDSFRAMDTMESKQVSTDPLYRLVRPYRDWAHGFVESEFRAWLGNGEVGPLAGPRMRPFVYINHELATLLDAPAIEAETAVPSIEDSAGEVENSAVTGIVNEATHSETTNRTENAEGRPARPVRADDTIGKKIQKVIGLAQTRWSTPSNPSPTKMAENLIKTCSKELPYRQDAIKKILEGSYSPMMDRGIRSPYRG